MKKSDLTRRARNYGQSVYAEVMTIGERNASADAFEAGYRAARADLRRHMKAKVPFRTGEYWTMSRVRQWLRPIR